jgi:hypothetical protein
LGNNCENHNDTGKLYNNHIFKHPNINYISFMTSTVNNYPDNCINEKSSITVIPHSPNPVSLASNASWQSHAANLIGLTIPDMAYTGTEANLLERSLDSQVGPRIYPLESVVCFTSAGKAQLTTLQSSGREPRTDYGVQM